MTDHPFLFIGGPKHHEWVAVPNPGETFTVATVDPDHTDVPYAPQMGDRDHPYQLPDPTLHHYRPAFIKAAVPYPTPNAIFMVYCHDSVAQDQPPERLSVIHLLRTN